MDLKQRLAQLDRLSRKAPVVTDPPSATDLAQVLVDLGLVREEGPQGPVWYVEHHDDIEPPPAELPDLTGLFTSAADACPPLSSILLLDTETTGLAGGTGTLVFQVGLSWWNRTGLVTRQYFLPGPADEPALLHALAELSQRFSHVVTYNGASFDLPLLRTRALLNRLPGLLDGLISWDLLVPARRLWRHRLADCRQQSVEAHLVGRERAGGDIDGARIPQAWFDFLHTGRPGLLGNVLTHNHRDMVGMARIFTQVCLVAGWLPTAANGMPSLPTCLPDDRASAWALGRIFEYRQDRSAAAACFGRAWEDSWGLLTDERQQRQFRRDAIRNLKREREWALVAELIQDGLAHDEKGVALHLEAAILYEHRLVDPARALRHALQAADDHRVARLRRLLAGGATRAKMERVS